jgi:hypothetical protein
MSTTTDKTTAFLYSGSKEGGLRATVFEIQARMRLHIDISSG